MRRRTTTISGDAPLTLAVALDTLVDAVPFDEAEFTDTSTAEDDGDNEPTIDGAPDAFAMSLSDEETLGNVD